MQSSHVLLSNDETARPAPDAYPPLLSTLQTYSGMVGNDGQPRYRSASNAPQTFANSSRSTFPDVARAENIAACLQHVSKSELIKYIHYKKRLDIEQAVAMVISYLMLAADESASQDGNDDFETSGRSAVDELIRDAGTEEMLAKAYMWREPADFILREDAHVVAERRRKTTILAILGGQNLDHQSISDADFALLLQTLRRRRAKMGHQQHLSLPEALIARHFDDEGDPWSFHNSYRDCQDSIHASTGTRIISKRQFARIYRQLSRMRPPHDTKSAYVHDVDNFLKDSGRLAGDRIAALKATSDPYAITYAFIAAQRRLQLKVVSDYHWLRFLVPGEGRLILQNRPDVLTSFEDVLVRHATDLCALTAIACPPGVRDHFDERQSILDRVLHICEFMERYVSDFGGGRMQNLVFSRDSIGGGGRGPVGVYNRLCDELNDCRIRASAAGLDLEIGPVYKFLAKDILAWNNDWDSDAFAGGKVPGWVVYLAEVRMDEMDLGD